MDDLPVLVGAAAFSHRGGETPPLTDLLLEAAHRAAADAGGGPALLDRVGWVGVPKGAWTHPDPGRVLAPRAHTVLAEVGILQQEVIDRACRAIQEGTAEVALVAGGETAYRSTALAAGAVVEARSAASEPDEHLSNLDAYVNATEVNARFYDPPVVYAAIENAFAAARGWDADEHRRRLGELWAGFSAVAAANPDAWTADRFDAGAIVEPGPGNRMVSEPYTKRCCSNLRVDQAAALLLTTVATARRLGIDEARWVFPLGSAVANHAVPVSQRPELHRSANARVAGERALALAGLDSAADVDHLDLYSCFPAAVQVAAAELGIATDRPLTVTGGMAFAGGPLNSYVLHALTAMAGVLRADPGTTGMVTSVSGFITKYGAGIWSTRPPAGGAWRADDVTAEAAAAAGATRPEAGPGTDPATLTAVARTVEHQRDGTTRTITVAETPEGARTVVTD